MAGGKETPRQKMIGMMYLVLTALLALNVSKSILDAFVAIEENTQLSNLALLQKGDGYIRTVESEKGQLLATKKAENAEKIKAIDAALVQMKEIDVKTGKMIEFIDGIKKEILEKSGEDIKTINDNNEETIMWIDYKKDAPCKPTRMNLMAVQAKDQYDVPMHEIVGEKLDNPSGSGKELWDKLLQYRDDIVNLAGSYTWSGKTFKVNTKRINTYENNVKLSATVKKMFDTKDVSPDDKEGLENIYIRLTKAEKVKHHDAEVHWIGKTFDHSPLVAAVASLSSLQSDVLSARAEALRLWKAKISTGEYSFDKIMPLAYGPGSARSGEDVELTVMMAAFDSQNKPRVEVKGGISGEPKIVYKNGQGIVTFKAAGSSMKLNGTVTIMNKSGAEKTEEWEYEVPVLVPTGAIELTELNVLYRGYPNQVMATGSGYVAYSLSGTGGLSIQSKGKDEYVVKPTGRGNKAFLTITGKDKDGNSSVLKKQEYRVSSLPDPGLYMGGSKSGTKASRNTRALIAKYPPEIPLKAKFKIIKWTCYAPGLKGAPPTGPGSNISSASALIKAVKPGSGLSFNATVRGPDGLTRQIGGSWSL